MAFKALIEGLVKQAMVIVDDLALKIDYVQIGAPTYNPTTGQIDENEVEVEDVTAVLARFSINEVDAEVIVTTDYKCLIAALDLPGVTPGINDRIRKADGKEYNVQRIMGVPGESLHILHVREV